MGCICSKGSRANQYVAEKNAKELTKKSSKRLGSFKKENVTVVEPEGAGNEATTRLINEQPFVEDEVGISDQGGVDKKAKSHLQRRGRDVGIDAVQPQINKISSSGVGEKGAQVVAGWPSWLTAVAGEAINGWVPRKADSFEKLDKIGQGTYSSVYRARDLENNKLVALKKVRFANMDPESVRFMAREIIILRRLDHPNVMKLEGLITSRVSGSIYLIFEYMEHDLTGLAAKSGVKFTEEQIKCYMQQLLRGLEHCHSRGILHRDIKGSNLLLDYNGNLKIGDFGLATFFQSPQKQPLTSRVVTLWYRPPELLLGSTEYGASVDLWSTGCILAELFVGKPIMPGRTEVEQLHKIFKLCGSPSEEYWKRSKLPHATIFKPQHPYKRCVAETFKDFPSSALSLLEVLLATEPDVRGTATLALQSEFFTTKPLPCDPSSLPKYPPSKEFDVKLQQDTRKGAAGGKGHAHGTIRKVSNESKAVPAPDANAELPASIQKRQRQPNPISCSENYNPEEESGSDFPIEPVKGLTRNGCSYSGQLKQASNLGTTWSRMTSENEHFTGPSGPFGSPSGAADLKNTRSYIQPCAASFSRFSNSVADRGRSQLDCSTESRVNWKWGDDSVKHDRSTLLDKSKSSFKKDVQLSGKDSSVGYTSKKNRIHFSGPLMPPGEKLEEMLREHERQIQKAVRKARVDKTKTQKTYSDNVQTESLLHNGRDDR
ncbi:probable serine/threonine-protein kinase At1g09600 isoform X2 [Mangifera indica]|uniref:probable serine/threonine-protein kinase At1g09600 isoform X2 n=1 Tax=Mangifera indica TaxID=29780 RepID=UPI001CFA315A|nr:probable serine/threonine-protein kinase At1g09600 isoform X2 [Mangifera indica]